MKTISQWNEDILQITMKIRNNYPELSSYLNEMPITIPNRNNPMINLENLEDYYNSLHLLLKQYALKHNNR